MRTRTDAAARARARRIAHHAAVCDRSVRWAHGTAVAATELPDYWDLNVVRWEDAAALSAQELADMAQELQAGLRHRRVEAWDPGAAQDARPGLEALGWETEVELWMRQEGSVRPEAGHPRVEPVAPTAVRPLRSRWTTAGEAFLDQRELADLRRPGELRAFGVREGGELVAFATLYVQARAAELEELFVREDHRGRGHGRALLAEAMAAVGEREVWIVADDEGWPKDLYARLGFVGAWRLHHFTRHPR